MKVKLYIYVDGVGQIEQQVHAGDIPAAIEDILAKGVAESRDGMMYIHPPHRVLSVSYQTPE